MPTATAKDPAADEKTAGPPTIPSITPYQRRVLAITCLITATLGLDYLGFTIALPVIGKEFGVGTTEVGWIMNANQLGFAATVVGLGRIADMLGRVSLMIAGCGFYVVGAAISGSADGVYVLIAGRAIIGISAATIAVSGLATLSVVFDRHHYRRAVGILTASGMASGIVGPFVGGFLTEFYSWRWFFAMDAALAVLALLLLVFFLKEPKRARVAERFDLPGYLTMAAGIVLFIIALDAVDRDGWESFFVIGGLVGAAGLFLAFYLIERQMRSPLVDFSLFRNRDFLGGCLILLFSAVTTGALMLFLTLYLQHVLGLSPLMTGAIFLAWMVPGTALSLVSGPILDRFGIHATLVVSTAIAVLAFVCFGFSKPDTGLALILLGLVLVGIGKTLSGNAASVVALGNVAAERAGAASGILKSIRAIGATLGVASAGALFRTTEQIRLNRLFDLAGNRLSADEQSEIRGMLSGSDAAREKLSTLVPEMVDRIDVVVGDAFAHAFRDVMFFFIAVSAAAFVTVFIIRPDADT